jgi:hypothetical protein
MRRPNATSGSAKAMLLPRKRGKWDFKKAKIDFEKDKNA